MQRLVSQTIASGLWQTGLQEYILAAFPDNNVGSKISVEKQYLYQQYGIKTKTESYITVASFSARLPIEETLVRWIQRACSKISCFDVTVNNYSGFPPGKVYLRILNKKPFTQLAAELQVIDEFIQTNACPPADLITKPNIPIAANLPETIYLNTLMHYAQKCFHESFAVKQLVLLRRANDYEERKVVSVFPLRAATTGLYN